MLKKIYFNNLPIQNFTAKNGNTYRRVILSGNTSHLIPDKIATDVTHVDVCIYLNTEEYSFKIGVYPTNTKGVVENGT